MPSKPRPFVATKAFSCAKQHYVKGDIVDNPIVIAAVRGYGDQFIVAQPPKTPPPKNEGA